MIITTVCLTRFGLKRFEKKINKLLSEGSTLVDLKIEKLGLFRLYCVARFSQS